MTSLVALWQFSLILCGIAFLALLALLVARALTHRHAAARQRARRRLVGQLMQGAEGPLPRGWIERAEAIRLTGELAELVRGSDRAALIERAEALGVGAILRKRLRSHSPQERLLATELLAVFPGAHGEVTAMLADRNPDVRLGAALSLASCHAAPPADRLVRMLGLGTREKSLLVVSLMRDLVETDPSGVEALLHDPSLPDAPKLAATDALAASGRVEHAPLVAWMADAATHDTALQPRIYRALGRIGHPGGHAAIGRGLGSDWWQTRSAAVEAAGRSGMVAAAPRLAELLGDLQWWVRFRAGEALARLGHAGHGALLAVAQSPDAVAAEAARAIIAEKRLGELALAIPGRITR